MFAWMALLGMGVFPHYAGKEAYRLATAQAMEKPLDVTYGGYRLFWAAQFRRMAEIVLLSAKWFGGAKITSVDADISTDSMSTIDLLNASSSLSQLFKDILIPLSDAGSIPKSAVVLAGRNVFEMAMNALGGNIPTELADKFTELFKKIDEEQPKVVPQPPTNEPQNADTGDEPEQPAKPTNEPPKAELDHVIANIRGRKYTVDQLSDLLEIMVEYIQGVK